MHGKYDWAKIKDASRERKFGGPKSIRGMRETNKKYWLWLLDDGRGVVGRASMGCYEEMLDRGGWGKHFCILLLISQFTCELTLGLYGWWQGHTRTAPRWIPPDSRLFYLVKSILVWTHYSDPYWQRLAKLCSNACANPGKDVDTHEWQSPQGPWPFAHGICDIYNNFINGEA